MKPDEGSTGVEKEPSNIEEMPDEGVNSYTWEQGYKDQIAALRNDLLDALDVKNGNGPTALSMVVDERNKAIAALKELIPIAEHATRSLIFKPEFAKQYDEAIENAKKLTQ